MLRHHRTLDEHVRTLTAAVARAVTDDTAYAPEVAKLIAYFDGEVLPHAIAEERTIYRVAGARADLAEMIAEHRSLAFAIESLAGIPNGPDANERAGQVAVLFAAHVAKENEVLLPALLEDGNVDLAELLTQMQRLTHAAQHEGSVADNASILDREAMQSHDRIGNITR